MRIKINERVHMKVLDNLSRSIEIAYKYYS